MKAEKYFELHHHHTSLYFYLLLFYSLSDQKARRHFFKVLPSFIFDNFWFQPPKTIIRSTYLSGEAWSILNFPLKSVGVSIENPFKLHVFFAHKHSKFWSIFLGQKVERNPLFSEEWQNKSGFLRYVIRSFREIISFFHFRINYTRDVRDRIMYVHVNSSWKYILYSIYNNLNSHLFVCIFLWYS